MVKTKKIAFMGIMLALMIALSAAEHMLPPLPFLPPGVKLGLANIVTMYCVFFINKLEAVGLNALKSLSVLLMRGVVAGVLSFCGGLLSIGVIILIVLLFKDKISYIAVSIAGAVAHNIGQFIAVSFILDFDYMLYYLPVLIVTGIPMGILTGTLLKIILPVFRKVLK